MQQPDFGLEQDLLTQGYTRIVGVDEVGRGPLAGPVYAAAVVLNPNDIPDGLNDSKKLSEKRRQAAYEQIMARADVGIGCASAQEIDEINILQASLLAMCRAVAALGQGADYALIDGNKIPSDLPIPATAVVKGDGKSLSIAAASIVAKTCRDRVMTKLAQDYPAYGWDKNAGYPTKMHLNALADLGVTPHHRRSYKPVHNILCKE